MRSCRFPAIVLLVLAGCSGQAVAPSTGLPAPGSPLIEWTPEQRLAAYRQFDKMWPAHDVKRGPTTLPLAVAATPVDPRVIFEDGAYTTDAFMEANRISGLMAVKNGQIVLERYAFGRQPDDRWVSFSVTKSITSTLIGAAVKDGHIKSLRDRVTKYVPELKGSAYDRVTIQQLLTMQSGVDWNEDYADAEADVYRFAMQRAVGALNPTVRYMKALQRAAPPGSKFLYNTGETDLAGFVLSSAVGKPLQDYLSEKIWAPFGMERDASWPMDRGGHAHAGCCLSMTLRDYARFGLFMLNGGKAGDRQVLPDGWIAEATRRHVTEPGYGYFWWAGEHTYVALGIHGQAIYVVPGNQLVVVVNSAWPTAWDATNFARQEKFVQGISDAVRSAPASNQ